MGIKGSLQVTTLYTHLIIMEGKCKLNVSPLVL